MIPLEDIGQQSSYPDCVYPNYIDAAGYIIVVAKDKQLLRVSIDSGEVNFPSYGEGEHGYMRLNALYEWTFTPAPDGPFKTPFNTGCISITRASASLFTTYIREREIAKAKL